MDCEPPTAKLHFPEGNAIGACLDLLSKCFRLAYFCVRVKSYYFRLSVAARVHWNLLGPIVMCLQGFLRQHRLEEMHLKCW